MEKRGRTKAPETTRPDDSVEATAPLAAEDQDDARADRTAADRTAADRTAADRTAADDADRPEHAELYGRLATPFDVTFRDLRGGVELEYVRRITRR